MLVNLVNFEKINSITLTSGQCQLLNYLFVMIDEDNIVRETQSDLAKELKVSRQTIGARMKFLCQVGFVDKKKNGYIKVSEDIITWENIDEQS